MSELVPNVRIVQLPHAKGLPLPAYQTKSAAGMDLCAALKHPITLNPGERALLPTGLQIALPEGYEAQIRPRSGLAIKHGITMLNAPGTIDADYRGEIMVIAINHGQKPVQFDHGDRVAQMVISPVMQLPVIAVEHLDETERGDGGFGSTGI